MLRVLIDEDTKSRRLVQLLKDAGHDVRTTSDFQLDGQTDSTVLAKAVEDKRVILTRNCGDFLGLHQQDPAHCGILMIFQEPKAILTYEQILRAITNLEQSGAQIEGECQSLNAWSY